MRQGLKKRYLVGDVGGTKTLLSLLDDQFVITRKQTYMNHEKKNLQEIVKDFVDEEVEEAIFGIAGPVFNGVCKMTNLPWEIREKDFEASGLIKKARIYNDLRLQAEGIKSLEKNKHLPIVKKNRDPNSSAVLLSVGTGLGEAILHKNEVLPCEGGHSDYAPGTNEEIQLLHFFRNKYGFVSFEKLLSGKGVSDLYEFYSGEKDVDPGEVFVKKERAAMQAKKMFFQTLGKETSIFSLKTLPFNGVYFFGGVICKNIEHFDKGAFLEGFYANKEMNHILQKIPVDVAIEENISMNGAVSLFLRKKDK